VTTKARKTTAAPAKPAEAEQVTEDKTPDEAPTDVTADEAPTDEETTDEAAEAEQAPPVPASGDLDAPPEVPVEADTPVEQPAISGELGIAQAAQKPTERLFDDATGDALDPDTLFEKLEGVGTTYTCTKRIMQELNRGEGWSSTTVLVMPAGQVVSQDRADQLVALVKAQAAGE